MRLRQCVTLGVAFLIISTVLPPRTALALTEGADNNFFGTGAGANNSGMGNTFVGGSAGTANTSGSSNSFIGRSAGRSTTTGGNNTFVGFQAGSANSTGLQNAFFGTSAGASNTNGQANSLIGPNAGMFNTEGQSNTFLGASSGLSNTNEDNNTFIGALSDGDTAITNATALGHRALVDQSNSLVLGSIDGVNGATDSVNVGIGSDTPDHPLQVVKTTPGGTAASVNEGALLVNRTDGSSANIRFSNLNRSYLFQNNPTNQVFSIINETAGNTPFSIFPDAGSNTFVLRSGRWGLGVGAPAAGRAIDTNTGAFLSTAGVWTDASSRSLKDNIRSLSNEEALSVLRALDPVTFTYQRAPRDEHVGFISEDVPELVATADRLGLAPMDIVAVAVRVLQAKDTEIAKQSSEIEALKAEVGQIKALLAD